MLTCPLRPVRPVPDVLDLPERLDEDDTEDREDTPPGAVAGADVGLDPVLESRERPAGGRPQSSHIPSTILPEHPGRPHSSAMLV